ncbi:hypothetical protein EaACW_0236 [Erwinia amylovora ACW56400]|uniref:Uncharacterized protein n=2 Tax=Erwinia amylovora TaxID=552 RepID=A0A830ZWA8_ERWAM|nr:hypothetical protein EaACW_0236 [Erwinia amylovora ACW56400]CBA19173.1 hypothetical protein predicted by Glimmer/Critica [Erwinia amylovora CFBP1430]CCO77081.1 hypothetical protein BN432_0241 [Erwinia amylovora Ea356]CCO80863.1 hypothetical protein BN433_0248 [Erwinia amylovora Ea266]CCO84669.1 hypothetical protein BN434_0238 [Erwinia amylovora CFBP 2585]CCO88457.1 hypothetical protein BN435_0243 [Erwinia amylovora 01SFR-BO]CCO92212.1 hypothetical protein BN437_0240 [Erwinia amylovora NBRC
MDKSYSAGRCALPQLKFNQFALLIASGNYHLCGRDYVCSCRASFSFFLLPVWW